MGLGSGPRFRSDALCPGACWCCGGTNSCSGSGKGIGMGICCCWKCCAPAAAAGSMKPACAMLIAHAPPAAAVRPVIAGLAAANADS